MKHSQCMALLIRFLFLFFIFCGTAFSAEYEEYYQLKVIKVSDGDTITVMTPHGQKKRVRLAEIDAPESNQAYGKYSAALLQQWLSGGLVSLKVSGSDQYGRWLAHIYVGDVWLNGELVKAGAAWVYPQYAKTAVLYQYEIDARQAKIGIWSQAKAKQIAPWQFRRGQR